MTNRGSTKGSSESVRVVARVSSETNGAFASNSAMRRKAPPDCAEARKSFALSERQTIGAGLLLPLLGKDRKVLPPVTFEPRGGYVTGGRGSELLESEATFLTDGDREMFAQNPESEFLFFYDETRPGLAPILLKEALYEDLARGMNVWNGLTLGLSLDEAGFDDAGVCVVGEARKSAAYEIVRLYRSVEVLGEDRRLIQYRALFRKCREFIGSEALWIDTTPPLVSYSLTMQRQAFSLFERLAKAKPSRDGEGLDGLAAEGGLASLPAPALLSEDVSPADQLRDEGVDPTGRVIVHIPGHRPYLRPTGWLGQGDEFWRLGEGTFREQPRPGDHAGRARAVGRLFSRHFGEWIEGGAVEDADYIRVASAILDRLAGVSVPGEEHLRDPGINPFVMGPATPIGDHYSDEPSPPRPASGIDLSGNCGLWSPVMAMRSLVLARARPVTFGSSLRSTDYEDLALHLVPQDFADTDRLRAWRRRLLGFLGPRAMMVPELLERSGFTADPLGRTMRAHPQENRGYDVLDLLAEDAEHLTFLRTVDREVAERTKDLLELQRIEKSFDYLSRDVIVTRPSPAFADRYRPDLAETSAQFERDMQDLGAELILVPDPMIEGSREQRVPWHLGFVPGNLLEVDPADAVAFGAAYRTALSAMGWDAFVHLPMAATRDRFGDAMVATRDLQEDEVLFSEFSLLMGSREFRRRISVMVSNGVSDWVAPTWRKPDRATAVGSDRFSPFVAVDDSPLELPFEPAAPVKGHSFRGAPRSRSDEVTQALVWAGWGLGAGAANEVAEEDLHQIVEALYPPA